MADTVNPTSCYKYANERVWQEVGFLTWSTLMHG